ncbi:hypothetical protein NDU88_005171 [Pleurodeles waltl]|uniref:Uncharacterized protein n=1 Tax=Pleurodeles waltl TaxID=8319 RepID=A0AAV7QI26_PLEWA|nr:hypothetical protein NDU88_005171 [Pleurodeles waltl]
METACSESGKKNWNRKTPRDKSQSLGLLTVDGGQWKQGERAGTGTAKSLEQVSGASSNEYKHGVFLGSNLYTSASAPGP